MYDENHKLYMLHTTYEAFAISVCVALTLLTSHTGIFTMASGTGVISPNSLTCESWTVNKSHLSSSTQ